MSSGRLDRRHAHQRQSDPFRRLCKLRNAVGNRQPAASGDDVHRVQLRRHLEIHRLWADLERTRQRGSQSNHGELLPRRDLRCPQRRELERLRSMHRRRRVWLLGVDQRRCRLDEDQRRARRKPARLLSADHRSLRSKPSAHGGPRDELASSKRGRWKDLDESP